MTAPDLGHARQFIRLVDPSTPRFTFQVFDDNRERKDGKLARILELEGFAAELLDLYRKGTGVWVTVNETDGKGRKSANITRIRAIWQEDDDGFEGEFPLPPSLEVETSAGHFHRYWFVSGNWPADEKGRTDFAGVMRRMVVSYGSDKNAADICRVLRVPGFLNRGKNGPHPVRAVGGNQQRYTRAEILQAFPLVPEDKPKHTNGHTTWHPQSEEIERTRSALAVIPADARNVWVKIGMGLKDELGESGYPLWLEWSQTCSEKYDRVDCRNKWESFRGKGTTIASLFGLAIEHGWKEHRPKGAALKAPRGDERRQQREPSAYAGPPLRLYQVHEVFARWFGKSYDLRALDAVLAASAAARLTGDPLWLLVVGGSGGTKTETVVPLEGAGAHIVSTIASEGALLSASSGRSKVKDATGGLLRQLKRNDIVVIKDVTSILSMNGDARAAVLAALREVYDGRWVRKVGSDGGQSLTWAGRLTIVGAVTTAWDTAHSTISRVGDRFVLVRFNTSLDRTAAGLQALDNVGSEEDMRRELREAVAGLMLCVDLETPFVASQAEKLHIVGAADLVTRARSAVDLDNRGAADYAHDPEAPTRFAKQLLMIVRGAVAVGMGRGAAFDLALRCARDSMPPLRRDIILDIAAAPGSKSTAVRRRLQKPYTTVNRQLEALQMLGVLTCEEEEEQRGERTVHIRSYWLAADIKPTALDPIPDEEKML